MMQAKTLRLPAFAAMLFSGAVSATAQQLDIQELLRRIEASEARIQQLEAKLAGQEKAATPQLDAAANLQPASQTVGDHDHMTLPGGPKLKINGFSDVNFGTGSVANPLAFPLPTPVRSSFQLGEFDLFLSSQLATKWSFLGELVIGADSTNEFGMEIERLQLTYRANDAFAISAGRFHSSIGYYNTAFHHGTWFQTAQGRPFMFYFEDAGGILPLHDVGFTATGEVPGTTKVGLHWIAEVGNGRRTSTDAEAVQNFTSDRGHKTLNFAAYIQPAEVPGLQIGGSYYVDKLAPIEGAGRVSRRISSIYAVFADAKWEFLNEAVLLSHRLPTGRSYNSPLAYTQFSRKFGLYRPYVRYQYVNVAQNDPIRIFTGRYNGPSIGLRIDVTDYAAFKIQYNRVGQRGLPSANGLNAQIAFAF